MATTRHPHPAKLPDFKILKKQVDQGRTNRELAEQYNVSTEWIRVKLKEGGIVRGSTPPDFSTYIPWPNMDKGRHRKRADPIYRCLSAWARRQLGIAQPNPPDDATLDEWITYMDGQNPLGMPLSVHYNRTDGFTLKPRVEGDHDYIHPPD